MRLALSIAVVTLVVAPPAAAVTTSSEGVDGSGGSVFQELTFTPKTLHYRLRKVGGTNVQKYCVVLRLERFARGSWHGIGHTAGRGRRDCVQQSPQPEIHYDAWLTPRRSLRQKIRSGHLRIHAWVDLGWDISIRL